MNAKILITGASGLLGRTVLKHFENESTISSLNWKCLGLCFNNKANSNLKKCDLTDFVETNNLINEFKPNVIIHCAAERKIEAVESNFETTLKLNVDATKNLTETSAKLGIFLVYISTDYVFDGKNPPYQPTDQPNPLNKYGISKLNGEKVILDASKNNCVVRVPVLYSDEQISVNESAVTVLFNSVKQVNVQFKMDNVQARYPLHCLDVARFLEELVKKHFEKSEDVKGIFHCGGPDRFTKYEISCLMADLFNLPKTHIIADLSSADPSLPQIRPSDAKLDTTSSYKLLNNFHTTIKLKDCLKQCLDRFL